MKKLEATITRYFKDDFKPTEDDYIECTINGGMSWRWDYKSMSEYAKHNEAYGIADWLFDKITHLKNFDYKIIFRNEKIKQDEEE